MGQWEPLADHIPVDMRRLATQLRRMKDRSGLTVPALAARTAQSAQAWAGHLAADTLPPLAAVEVLAQASGADYDRVGALWKLAEKASKGTGERGRGKPLPDPDPLDPLTSAEGMPAARRRAVLLAAAGVCAVAALLAVVLMAGPGSTRAPDRGAAPTPPDTATATAPHAPPGPATGTHPSQDPAPAASTPPALTTTPTPGTTTTPPPAASTPQPPPPSSGAAPPPASSAPATSDPAPPPSTPAPTPTPTHTGLCLGLIVLGICIG